MPETILDIAAAKAALWCCIQEGNSNCSNCPYDGVVTVTENGTHELGDCMRAMMIDAYRLIEDLESKIK